MIAFKAEWREMESRITCDVRWIALMMKKIMRL